MDKIIEQAIALLQQDKQLPAEYQDILFPVNHAEYELTYKGKKKKQAVLSSANEPQSVPFQIQKQFGEPNGWNNLLIFGDNYQILKTMYENNDELIKDKVKGKVKLIYIDPPFSTQDEFTNKQGAKAYNDKVKGAEFVEFLRQRLILAREILADDGVIYVHLDYRKIHYIKLIMDEIFGENNFINEITWKRTGAHNDSGKYGINTEYILLYSKTENYTWNPQFSEYSEKHLSRFRNKDSDGRVWTDSPLTAKGLSGGGYTYTYRGITDIWRCPIETMERLDKENRIHITKTGGIRVKKYLDELNGTPLQSLWTDVDPINSQSKERVKYPTQKPEKLLERVIKASTNEGDLVMDFFAGSGTTLAVAERLNRRWIGCDIGKLAIYTIQKRFLTKESHKPFALVSAAIYDLSEVFGLDKAKYDTFVKNLFHIESEKKTIAGVIFDGKRRGDWARIFDFHYFKDNPAIDEKYIADLHKLVGKKVGSKVYLVAPEMNINVLDDYIELGGVRYYLLRIPYQAIKELHKSEFKKPQQPKSKANINNIETSVGFYLNEEPEVRSTIRAADNKVFIDIESIKPQYDSSTVTENILAMVLLDTSDGSEFVMQKYFFADEIISKQLNLQYQIKLNKKEFKSNKIRIVYVDIFGNEFTETLEVKQ